MVDITGDAGVIGATGADDVVGSAVAGAGA